MSTTAAAHLASELSGTWVSESTIRRLCQSGELVSEKEHGRYIVDEDSVRDYFG